MEMMQCRNRIPTEKQNSLKIAHTLGSNELYERWVLNLKTPLRGLEWA